MREFRPIILLLLFVGVMFFLPPDVMYVMRQVAMAATTYYVQTDGNNANVGTSAGAANAWADPGYAASVMGNGDWCYVKTGTYTLTSESAGAGGPIVFPAAGSRAGIEGYYATPGDRAMNGDVFTPPILQATETYKPTDMVTMNGGSNNCQFFFYFKIDGVSQAVNGVNGANATYDRCVGVYVYDCDASYAFDALITIQCAAISCAAYGFQFCNTFYSLADHCDLGFMPTIGNVVDCCIAANCSGTGFAGQAYYATNCVAYNNGTSSGHGFTESITYRQPILVNCVAYSHTTGYSFEGNLVLIRCADGGASSGRTSSEVIRDIYAPTTLTANPFKSTGNVDPLDDDYRPNSTAGGGVLLKAAGIGVFNQTDNRDIGAVQHADPAVSGGETSHVWVR